MTTTSNGITIIYGAAGLSPALVKDIPSETPEAVHAYTKQILDLLEKDGISTLDTAEGYEGSEAEIGFHGASDRFIVDTKLVSGFGPERTKEETVAAAKASLEKLKTKQVDILYLHAPDTRIPWEEQLSALQELYDQGSFKRLGLSNFTAEQVQELWDAAKKDGTVLPSVYQGSYSAVSRLPESQLLPTLRKLGIIYYAYSPIAGGFLAKTRKQIQDGAGRYDPSTMIGQLYLKLYNKPSYLDALDTWGEIAEHEKISKAELAYRWATYHSALQKGDGIIFGSHSIEHVSETIGFIRAGPLPADAAEKVNQLWDGIKQDAPLDNFNH